MPQYKKNSNHSLHEDDTLAAAGRHVNRRSDPKLFRCTGFGNCDMVFTRSEHLARHARKHTGEKPFKCVVPNCTRMFSRFDNMMQHTHTHNRTKKKDALDSSEEKFSPVPEEMTSPYAEQHRILPRSQEHPSMYYQQQHVLPPSPVSDEEYYKYQHYQQTHPAPYMSQPQHWSSAHYSPATPPPYHTTSRRNSIQSQQKRGPPPSHIELTTPIQELGYGYHTTDDEDDDERQMSPISMCTSSDCTTASTTTTKKESRFGLDITADEYEALQGFGKFCTEPVVREPMLMTRITTSPTCSVSVPIELPPLRNHLSPTAVLSNTSSQVHAFRQHIPTAQESFRRGGF